MIIFFFHCFYTQPRDHFTVILFDFLFILLVFSKIMKYVSTLDLFLFIELSIGGNFEKRQKQKKMRKKRNKSYANEIIRLTAEDTSGSVNPQVTDLK